MLLEENIYITIFITLIFVVLGFWVHCNDSKLTMCTMEEVCKAQAYILFYTQRVTLMNGHWRMSDLDSPSGKQANTEVNGSNAKSDS